MLWIEERGVSSSVWISLSERPHFFMPMICPFVSALYLCVLGAIMHGIDGVVIGREIRD